MRAAVVTSAGELAEAETPDPEPGPGEVLIEVDAIGAGFVDVMAVRGEYPGFPGEGSVPGFEVAGRVTALGPDVPGELTGQPVLAIPAFGGYAAKVTAAAGRVLPAPPGHDAAEVVALGVNALVAELGLHRVGLAAGERVLVRGAGGGIGVLATQIAAARGATVTAVTSSAARGERLRALGAARIVDRTASARPDETYDVVVDPVGGADLGAHLGLLRDNGRYLVCGAAGGRPEPEAFAPMLRDFHRSPTLYSFSLNSIAPAELRRSWERILLLLGESRISPVLDEHFPLGQATAALRRLTSGKVFGKVVLRP